MRVGCAVPFTGSDEDMATLARLSELGYRYLEPSVEVLHAHGEPSAYYAVRRALNRSALSPEAFFWWHPPHIHLIGDDVDWPAAERYLALVLERIEELDGLVLAITSAYSRDFTPDYPADDAVSQVRYFLNMAADYAGDVGIAVGRVLPEGDDRQQFPGHDELVQELGRPEISVLGEPVCADNSPSEGMGVDCGHVHIAAQDIAGLGPDEAAEWLRSEGNGAAARASVIFTEGEQELLHKAEAAARALGLVPKA